MFTDGRTAPYRGARLSEHMLKHNFVINTSPPNKSFGGLRLWLTPKISFDYWSPNKKPPLLSEQGSQQRKERVCGSQSGISHTVLMITSAAASSNHQLSSTFTLRGQQVERLDRAAADRLGVLALVV